MTSVMPNPIAPYILRLMFGRVGRERIVGAAWGTFFTGILAVVIVAGSRNLQHFDAALVGYTFAVLFATFAITHRYAMWLRRPPTRRYRMRGWRLFFSRKPPHELRGADGSPRRLRILI